MNRFIETVSALIIVLAFCVTLNGQEKVDFATEVQPLFAQRCYKCHGPDAAEAGLRLNSREDALKELESGDHAIVPSDLDAGTLLDRLRSDEDGYRMPPEGKPLTDAQIKSIEKWIAQGAAWAKHWAFEPVKDPAVPTPENSEWATNPIDRFILQKLESNELSPAKPASKVSLIRRVYYDLIGLAPTPEQVDAFVNDKSGNALEKVVDQLLDSPQYGEKWARHWLDLVRYAETNGYERDSRKDLIWKYRDYVIRALNKDKPYDRFLTEQLAGDELPELNGDAVIATGFYRLGVWDDEPADRELARYDYLDDILRTTGESMLGMTIGCARCHDHKIDPIAQKDYYSMLAFFSDIKEHGGGRHNHIPVPNAESKAAFEKKVADKAQLELSLKKQIQSIEVPFMERLRKEKPDAVNANNASLPADGILIADSLKEGQEWLYTFDKPADQWNKIAFDGDKKWKRGKGTFGTNGTPGAKVRTTWATRNIWLRKYFRLDAIPSQLTLHCCHDEDTEVFLNGKLIATFKGYRGDYVKLDVTEKAIDVLQTGRNTIAIHCKQTGGGQNIDISLRTNPGQTPTVVYMRKFGEELIGKEQFANWTRMKQQLGKSQAEKLEYQTEFAMGIAENSQRKTWILGRGSPANKGDEVQPAYVKVLNPPAYEKSDRIRNSSGKRLQLARWITSKDNPMTARVVVNRLWQHHFGRGIVRSTSDFGYQGTPPTHPQLLDWLASQLVKGNWKLKRIHKMMMLSSTYQMSSTNNAAAYEKDPTNDLFWRFNMRRLTAEEIRDSILQVTGVLNKKMFGDSIFPPLPKEVLSTSSTPGSVWGRSSEEDSNRRSIYIHVKRSLRMPMLESFDSPDPDSACAVRVTTTVPTQALGMLNSKFMNEQAQKLANRLKEASKGDLEKQVRAAIRLTTGRTPSASEIEKDMKFISELQTAEKLSLKDAMKNYCLIVLNTNEFFYLD